MLSTLIIFCIMMLFSGKSTSIICGSIA